ncbi:MAG: transcriptional regulator [Rhodomicrobium sp.]
MDRIKRPYKPNPELLKENPHLAEFYPFLHELNHESDRGSVLICCSYIEDLLRESLRSFFLAQLEADNLLEGFNAPLGSLSARATAAYCCGLISEREFTEIKYLRKIRNEFAHNKTASFEDNRIADLCRNLTFCVPDKEGEPPLWPQGKFVTAAVSLIANLTNRPHYVSEHRCPPREWPY